MAKKSGIIKWILIAVTAILITVASIIFPGNSYRIMPLYVSLAVMLLQTNANRVCFLLGGINSLFYAGVYFSLELYASSLYWLLFSCPIQIVTYFRWRKHAYKQSTILRRLTGKQRLFWGTGMSAAWIVLYLILREAHSAYLILDNTITVIGIAGTFFSLLSLIEFPYFAILGQILSILLYSVMLRENPAQLTYLIFSVYALICNGISAVYMQRLYNRQREEMNIE